MQNQTEWSIVPTKSWTLLKEIKCIPAESIKKVFEAKNPQKQHWQITQATQDHQELMAIHNNIIITYSVDDHLIQVLIKFISQRGTH